MLFCDVSSFLQQTRCIWLQVTILLLVFAWSPTLSKENANEYNYTWPVGVTLKEGATYDYIVVGAGAAGSAAAGRLALAGHSVLLVEAGPPPTSITKIPALSLILMGSSLDWQYPTIGNNASCLSSVGGACRFTYGKCLGGSTSINHMLYTRGNPRDYEYPLPGWSWPELEPYFLRAEGFQNLRKLPQSSARYHNTTGPMKIDFFEESQNPWQARLYRAYQELAFPANCDVNAESQIGVSRILGYVHGGERMSTARAYLTLEDVKRHLHVATDTLCTRVLLDNENVARGVAVLHGAGRKLLQLRARREVLLSAGTVGSPHLLMLSGIGPADHLTTHTIPVRADLPVGEDLTDHVLPVVVILVDRGKKIDKDINNLLNKLVQPVKFFQEHAGPLASIGITDITAFVNTKCFEARSHRLKNESSECELPSMQYIHTYIDRKLILLARPLMQQTTSLNQDILDQFAAANVDNALLVVAPIVLAPHSRGKIQLASAKPTDPPAIYPNYLADERDVEEMIRGIRILRDLVKTSVFRDSNAKILKLKLPGCDGRGDEYWRCYVRHMTSSVYHAVGTCGLGRVVDERFRVLGVRRLRVADASVLSRVPRANPAAAAIALGERAADFIAKDRTERLENTEKFCAKG